MADMQKSKLKVSELAQGYRMYNLARSMNINEVEIETFLPQLNDECIRRNIEPPQLVSLLKQVIEFSRNQNVSLGEAPALIERLARELECIRKETKDAKADRAKALAENNMTDDTIKEYLDLRSTLMKYGLPATGPQTLVRTLQNVEALGHNPTRIVEMFSKIKSFQDAERQHQLNCRKWENRAKSFESTYELARWFTTTGFTPDHVEVLADIVKYIAEREGISVKEANGRLLVDLRLYFNREKLRSEVPELENKMKVLKKSILYDFYERFGSINALILLDTIKQIVAKDYNWDANLRSRDLKDLRRWRKCVKRNRSANRGRQQHRLSLRHRHRPVLLSHKKRQFKAPHLNPMQSRQPLMLSLLPPMRMRNMKKKNRKKVGGKQTQRATKRS